MNKEFEEIQMSDKLKNEYKALIHQDVPDLWSRIEAGLEPKQQNKVPETQYVGNMVQNNTPGKKVVKFRKNLRVWGSVAAACACVAIAIPVFTNNMSESITMENSATSDSAPQAEIDIPEADINNSNIMKDFAADDYVFDDSAEMSVEGNYDTNGNMGIFDAEAGESEGEQMPSAKIKIISSKVKDETVIYKAIVLEGFGDSELYNGDEIEIYDEVSDEDMLEKAEEYTLSLEQDENDEGEIIYRIIRK